MKEKITCNHCNKAIMWYRSAIHETDFIVIDDKDYCAECINKIGHISVDYT